MRRLVPFGVVALVVAACVGDDASTTNDGPADAATPPADGAPPPDGPIADSAVPDGDAGITPFACPVGATFCEAWDDDPLLADWLQEISPGQTLDSVASPRSAPRALRASLTDTPSATKVNARLTREVSATDAVNKVTFRFDAQIARRDAPSGGGAGPLKIAGVVVGAFASFFSYDQQSLALHYSRADAGGVMKGMTASFVSGQWHSVEVVVQRRPTPQITFSVDGGGVTPAADPAVEQSVASVRALVGADTEIEGVSKPTGASEVEIDNVVLIIE